MLEARRRLWREARSLARANHPNVCQVYVLEERGVLVLVMELLDGLSLADQVRSHGTPGRLAKLGHPSSSNWVLARTQTPSGLIRG